MDDLVQLPGSNILLRSDGRVVLCDFGIVVLAGTESLTQSGTRLVPVSTSLRNG